MMPTRNLGIPGVNPPPEECDDELCPWHGKLPVRGRILEGKVVSTKMQRTITVLHEYLHYVPKYKRYERRRKKIHARCPPCIKVKEGDIVIIGECRPLAKTVSFVVIGKKEVR
ncbi:MAG: 30S ribosomal protein S17 [Thermoprotei archaeon]|nr:MAG: 30S ribosomal protein S17 [Thermoprotei archaeon]